MGWISSQPECSSVHIVFTCILEAYKYVKTLISQYTRSSPYTGIGMDTYYVAYY